MKKIYFILLTAVVSCANPEVKQTNTAVVSETKGENIYVSYGAKIDDQGAVSINELNSKIASMDTLFVKVESTINQTCTKKGCWMKVDLGDKDEMMVRFKDYGFFVPTEGQEGKSVIFEGKAYRDTVSVETLRHYAEDAGQTQEEIDQITEPEISIAFLADGVIIKQ